MTEIEHMIPIMEPDLSGDEKKYLNEAIDSGWISSRGKFIAQFEEELAAYHGVENTLVVSNGTVALHLAMEALGIGPGDEVIIPNLTFAASINAVLHTGAEPVLAEVDLSSYNLDVALVESYMTPKTKAIMLVHLYGNPCHIDEIKRIAGQRDLAIIEDNAEGLGSELSGKKMGTHGDVGTFSFYGNKTITTGEGGAIIFRDKAIYERARILRDHGMNPDKRYWHDYVGFNYRMTNMQAAIGCAQLARVDHFLTKKRGIADVYIKELFSVEGIAFQEVAEQALHSYWLFTALFPGKIQHLTNFLVERKIETRPVFYPLSEMPLYKSYSRGDYPISKKIAEQGLCLPSFPGLRDEQVDYIVSCIKSYYGK